LNQVFKIKPLAKNKKAAGFDCPRLVKIISAQNRQTSVKKTGVIKIKSVCCIKIHISIL